MNKRPEPKPEIDITSIVLPEAFTDGDHLVGAWITAQGLEEHIAKVDTAIMGERSPALKVALRDLYNFAAYVIRSMEEAPAVANYKAIDDAWDGLLEDMSNIETRDRQALLPALAALLEKKEDPTPEPDQGPDPQ
jgi:hypothetical protein